MKNSSIKGNLPLAQNISKTCRESCLYYMHLPSKRVAEIQHLNLRKIVQQRYLKFKVSNQKANFLPREYEIYQMNHITCRFDHVTQA
jgi:hypothetical protein